MTKCVNSIGKWLYKLIKDSMRGNYLCDYLCAVYIGCKLTAVIINWVPVLAKFTLIAVLKDTSRRSTKFRDMCAADSLNSLC